MKVQVPPFAQGWPAPVMLVGCGSKANPNIITISWFATVCSDPPTVSISVRPSRYSFDLIRSSGEFTLNVPLSGDLAAAKLCGEKSGREVRKFDALNLTPVECPPLDAAPMIAEFPLSLGCIIQKEVPLGTHHMFIARIVSAWCDENLKRDQATPLLLPEQQMVWIAKQYWGLTPLEK